MPLVFPFPAANYCHHPCPAHRTEPAAPAAHRNKQWMAPRRHPATTAPRHPSSPPGTTAAALTLLALGGGLDVHLTVHHVAAAQQDGLGRALHLLKLDVGKAAGAAGVAVVRDAHLGQGAALGKELADRVLRG